MSSQMITGKKEPFVTGSSSTCEKTNSKAIVKRSGKGHKARDLKETEELAR